MNALQATAVLARELCETVAALDKQGNDAMTKREALKAWDRERLAQRALEALCHGSMGEVGLTFDEIEQDLDALERGGPQGRWLKRVRKLLEVADV